MVNTLSDKALIDVKALANIIGKASTGWGLASDDAVILNGSRLEGLANDQSDVDAWIILSDQDHDRSVPVFDWLQGLHLNMSSYSRVMVEQLGEQLNALHEIDYEPLVALPINTLDRYYRVCSAYPVVNQPVLDCLQEVFSLPHLTRLLLAWTGLRVALELDKARHALEFGRPQQALLCVRRAAESAIDHLLASRGEVYPSLKWRFEKLARCAGSDSPAYREAWSLKAPGARDAASYLGAVEAYAATVGAGSYPVVPSRLQRAPSTQLFELGGRCYLVQGKAVLFELNPGGRWLWERLDGTRTEPELLAEYADACPTAGRAAQGWMTFLSQLLAAGLASYTTDTLF